MEKLLDTFSHGYVTEGYGLTECTMGATSNPPGRGNAKVGSVGLPVFDTEVKVVDLSTGEELSPGREGEVLIKGPQVMQGYYNKPEATAEVLEDGWLHTGDIGKMDEDGFLYITDRLKDMIIYKGYNVYPRELEEVLFQHPAVEQVHGQSVCAQVMEVVFHLVVIEPAARLSDRIAVLDAVQRNHDFINSR